MRQGSNENYTLRYLKLAQFDLDKIREFNKRFSANYQKAIIEKLERRCGSLAENPFGSPVYKYNPNFRKLIVDDYLVFYKVDEVKMLVSIYRILYGARDIKSILN